MLGCNGAEMQNGVRISISSFVSLFSWFTQSGGVGAEPCGLR